MVDGQTVQTAPFWESLELELTSEDSVNFIALEMNAALMIERSSVLKDANQSDQNPVLSFTPMYEERHVQNVVAVDEECEQSPSSFRFQGVAHLQEESLNGERSSFARGESPVCIEPNPARIGAYHQLLKQLSSHPRLTEKFKKKCKAQFRLAYERGRQMTVGEVEKLEENEFLEYKGMKIEDYRENCRWDMAQFKKVFKSESAKLISAFINTSIMQNRRPDANPTIVFGVIDGAKIVHGIWRRHDTSAGPFDYSTLAASFRLSLLESLDKMVHDSIIPFLPGVMQAISVQCQQLNVSQTIRDRYRISNDDAAFKLFVTLDMESDGMQFPQPCPYKSVDGHGRQQIQFYYRAPSPETVPITDRSTLQKLFRSGIPPELDQSFLSGTQTVPMDTGYDAPPTVQEQKQSESTIESKKLADS